MNEAAKLVIWPREPVQVGKSKVYYYSIVGIVMTDKPLDFPNESVVIGGTNGEITTAVEKLIEESSYTPPYQFGDASDALVGISELTPSQCVKVKKQLK